MSVLDVLFVLCLVVVFGFIWLIADLFFDGGSDDDIE